MHHSRNDIDLARFFEPLHESLDGFVNRIHRRLHIVGQTSTLIDAAGYGYHLITDRAGYHSQMKKWILLDDHKAMGTIDKAPYLIANASTHAVFGINLYDQSNVFVDCAEVAIPGFVARFAPALNPAYLVAHAFDKKWHLRVARSAVAKFGHLPIQRLSMLGQHGVELSQGAAHALEHLGAAVNCAKPALLKENRDVAAKRRVRCIQAALALVNHADHFSDQVTQRKDHRPFPLSRLTGALSSSYDLRQLGTKTHQHEFQALLGECAFTVHVIANGQPQGRQRVFAIRAETAKISSQ